MKVGIDLFGLIRLKLINRHIELTDIFDVGIDLFGLIRLKHISIDFISDIIKDRLGLICLD